MWFSLYLMNAKVTYFAIYFLFLLLLNIYFHFLKNLILAHRDAFMYFHVQPALEAFREALGDGIWLFFLDGKDKIYAIDRAASIQEIKEMQFFHQLEKDGYHVELPWNKVTALFNLARLLEQLHNPVTASKLYHLILFKVLICVCVRLGSILIFSFFSLKQQSQFEDNYL